MRHETIYISKPYPNGYTERAEIYPCAASFAAAVDRPPACLVARDRDGRIFVGAADLLPSRETRGWEEVSYREACEGTPVK